MSGDGPVRRPLNVDHPTTRHLALAVQPVPDVLLLDSELPREGALAAGVVDSPLECSDAHEVEAYYFQ